MSVDSGADWKRISFMLQGLQEYCFTQLMVFVTPSPVSLLKINETSDT